MRRIVPALLSMLVAACAANPGAPPPPPATGGPLLRILDDTRESPAPPLEGLLPFFYDLYTFRGDSGRTNVVAAFAVPAGSLERERRSREVSYHFDVTLVLVDTAMGEVIRTDDSVFVRLPRPPAGRLLLYTQVDVEAPPNRSTVQRVIMTDAAAPGMGRLYDSSFPIPDYGGDGLMLSDIALGQPDVQGGWRRGDITLALLPISLFPQRAFELYYEIYNLPAGRPYSTEIAFQKMPENAAGPGDAASPATRVRFSADARTTPDGMVQELRRMSTPLPPGRYLLTITITDEMTGETASRSRLFHVRSGGPGATLVPALPRGLLPRPSGTPSR